MADLPKIKAIILGINGWYDTELGNTISILIDAPDYYMILDGGNGIYKLDKYLIQNKPVYLFLSHFHLDHIEGLHILPKFRFNSDLNIIGQRGTREIINTLLNSPFSTPAASFKFKINIIEYPNDNDKIPIDCLILPLVHSTVSLGIRLQIGDNIIAYCPDTGYCANAVELAKNADIVFAECANLSGQFNIGWPHLNPETAAKIAVEASARKLILVHFDAENYKTEELRLNAQKTAASIFPSTVAGKDGMIIEI